MRRQPQQPGTLRERLAHEADLHLLEVPQPAVDQAAGARRRPDRDVVLLDQRHAHAATRGVEQGPGPDDPAAHDQQVPVLVGKSLQVVTAAGQRSVQEVWMLGIGHDGPLVPGERRIRHRM